MALGGICGPKELEKWDLTPAELGRRENVGMLVLPGRCRRRKILPGSGMVGFWDLKDLYRLILGFTERESPRFCSSDAFLFSLCFLLLPSRENPSPAVTGGKMTN